MEAGAERRGRRAQEWIGRSSTQPPAGAAP